LWPGITIDHSGKIKAGEETESVFVRKKRRFSGFTARATLFGKLLRNRD
jgi:hypothetical protein